MDATQGGMIARLPKVLLMRVQCAQPANQTPRQCSTFGPAHVSRVCLVCVQLFVEVDQAARLQVRQQVGDLIHRPRGEPRDIQHIV